MYVAPKVAAFAKLQLQAGAYLRAAYGRGHSI